METLAGIFLTLIVIALLVQYAKGGWAAVGAWLHAKFIGES